jgi:DMSO/TMAO reductase YedYZ heme-binding membrane subunit
MNKTSFFFLLILLMLAAVGAYQSLFPIPAQTSFDRFFALSGFILICISLLIGPLATVWPKSFALLIEPRRAVGIAAFLFCLVHMWIVVVVMFGVNIGLLIGNIGNAIAIPAGILLFLLAITSSDYAIKLYGPGLWKTIQRFNYLIFVLTFVHFILRANGLFTSIGGKTFVNLAEVFALLMGVVTVILQIAGFLTRRRMMEQNKQKMAQSAPQQE